MNWISFLLGVLCGAGAVILLAFVDMVRSGFRYDGTHRQDDLR